VTSLLGGSGCGKTTLLRLIGGVHAATRGRVVFDGEVIDTRGTADGAAQPFQLDRCHALKRDGEAVRQFYPRWYRPAAPAAGPGS
jgi:ABC-type Fe3+/spermidine/putrescine transport system ATPase subunit